MAWLQHYFVLGFLDPMGENSEFDDDEDGRAIVGTIIFKTTDSLLRVSYTYMQRKRIYLMIIRHFMSNHLRDRE